MTFFSFAKHNQNPHLLLRVSSLKQVITKWLSKKIYESTACLLEEERSELSSVSYMIEEQMLTANKEPTGAETSKVATLSSECMQNGNVLFKKLNKRTMS